MCYLHETGKVYRNLAIVQQKIYLYYTRLKNVVFTLIFCTHYDQGCLPQGFYHPIFHPCTHCILQDFTGTITSLMDDIDDIVFYYT